MATSMTSAFVSVAAEHLFPIWVELVLCLFSAVAYMLFSSKYIANLLSPKKQKKVVSPPSPQMKPTKAPHMKQSPKLPSTLPRTALGSSDAPSSTLSSPRSLANADEDIPQSSTVYDKDRSCHPNKKVAMRANDIRSCGRNGNLQGAIKVFEKLGNQADTTLVLNSMLDACVECHNLNKAIYFFERARSVGVADSVTYNKMMKGYLCHGQEADARRLLTETIPEGMANATSYHGLLNARVNSGDMRGVEARHPNAGQRDISKFSHVRYLVEGTTAISRGSIACPAPCRRNARANGRGAIHGCRRSLCAC